MMDAVAGAFSALKGAADITQGLLALKTDAAVTSKAVELNRIIFEVQQQLFTSQAEHAALQSKVRELESQVVNLKRWEQEKERYELYEFAPGTFVYRVKPSMQGTEPPHDICPNCYEKGVKSILQKAGDEDSYPVHACPHCGAKYLGERKVRTLKRTERRSWKVL